MLVKSGRGRVQAREPFVLVRVHVAASLVNAGGEFVVDAWRSCVDVGRLAGRRVDYVHVLVSHAQRADHLQTFIQSQLDVPVCHAFFVDGAAAQLSLRHLRHVDERHWLESVTVSHARALSDHRRVYTNYCFIFNPLFAPLFICWR